MKDVVRKLVREVLGERASVSARRSICTWWRVEVHDGDSRLVASELDKNLRTAYARIAIRLRARAVVNQSACNIDHEQIKNTPAWLELKLIGIQQTFPGEPGIELRNCHCGSTLGRELPREAVGGGASW